jgi:DNA-binding NarL/FixJ family response regulator
VEPQAGSTIGVAVVEDSAMLRELIEEAVAEHPGLHLTGSARSLRDAVEQIPWSATQFATIDLNLPDGVGVELGARVRVNYPQMRIAILSDYRRPGLLDAIPADEQTFWSYILKSSIDGRRQLGELLAFAAAHAYIDPRVTSDAGDVETAIAGLTEQQRQILALVARGLSNSAIGTRLTLADKSVEYHLRQVYARLGIAADTEANQRVTATVMYLKRYSLEDV